MMHPLVVAGLALFMATGAAPAAPSLHIALEPWVGKNLPTSIPGARKWRLDVSGVAADTVSLRVGRLPKRWVASFCTQRVCAPSRYVASLSRSGETALEFQVIPDDDTRAVDADVVVEASQGTALASTHVRVRTPR